MTADQLEKTIRDLCNGGQIKHARNGPRGNTHEPRGRWTA